MAAQKQAIQLAQTKLDPRRAAVIALSRTLGYFHLSQQCVHFLHA
jgi:hypothetical protein